MSILPIKIIPPPPPRNSDKYTPRKKKTIHRKVRHIEENHDEGTYNLVRNNESSLYTGFVIRREFVRDSAKSKGSYNFVIP